MRARPSSPPPSAVGCSSWQLRCSPPQWIYSCGHWLHLIPTFPWKTLDLPVLLGCPCLGKVFSCGHGQAAWGLVLAGIVCSESMICSSVIFPLGGESRQRRGRGSGGRESPRVQSCWEHPALAQGGPQHFQLLRVPSGPPFGTGDLGDPRDSPADCWERRLPALGAVLRLLKVIPLPAQPSQALPSLLSRVWSTPEPWGHLHCPARGQCPHGAAPGAAVPEDSLDCPGADAEVALLGHLPCDPFAFGAGIRPLPQGVET